MNNRKIKNFIIFIHILMKLIINFFFMFLVIKFQIIQIYYNINKKKIDKNLI
jgi:hypothetical protein